MSVLQSNTDQMLVAIPMVICLFAGFFRLDELWCKPQKKRLGGRKLTNWDQNGVPLCTDPEQNFLEIGRREH